MVEIDRPPCGADDRRKYFTFKSCSLHDGPSGVVETHWTPVETSSLEYFIRTCIIRIIRVERGSIFDEVVALMQLEGYHRVDDVLPRTNDRKDLSGANCDAEDDQDFRDILRSDSNDV